MKIAIMGAGVSGLTCALMLEKHGIEADIFEKRGEVGDRFNYIEAMYSMLHYPFDDAIRLFSEQYDIHIKPSSNIQKTYVYSENESACIDGHLGFLTMRGKHVNSVEKQLEQQLKGKVQFHADVTYDELSKEYTHIVLAAGDARYTSHLQQYDTAFSSTFLGATVKGQFDKTEVATWFDNRIAPKGMGYLLPHNDLEATLVTVYPLYPENEGIDKQELWHQFKKKAEHDLGQHLEIIDPFVVTDYIVGKSRYPRIGNTFFIGDCFGAVTPFLGFGQFSAMLTGVYAALDLAGKDNYERLAQPLYQNYHDSLTLRRAIEKLDNQGLDLVTKSLHLQVVERALTGRNFNPLKLLSRTLRPFARVT
ncbi:NAD(P)-binding protein [Bacillus tianshenii]|nr:NAD(P)-binding protein [Bacillus tianshenii]